MVIIINNSLMNFNISTYSFIIVVIITVYFKDFELIADLTVIIRVSAIIYVIHVEFVVIAAIEKVVITIMFIIAIIFAFIINFNINIIDFIA